MVSPPMLSLLLSHPTHIPLFPSLWWCVAQLQVWQEGDVGGSSGAVGGDTVRGPVGHT